VRTISAELAQRIVAEREAGGPYRDLRDLARRVAAYSPPPSLDARAPRTPPPGSGGPPAQSKASNARRTRADGKPLSTANLEALATADAFVSLGLARREALWAAGAAAQERPDRLPGTALGVRPPTLPGMDAVEEMVADVWATGLAPDRHPVQFVRDYLTSLGAHPVGDLSTLENGGRILVGGLVTHRQRPATASGITFLNLEDETGMLNVICSPGLWQRFRRVARTASAMVIRGKLELAEGVTNLVAEHIAQLRLPVRPASRDFR
jgi:error-prone DNA polymerase